MGSCATGLKRVPLLFRASLAGILQALWVGRGGDRSDRFLVGGGRVRNGPADSRTGAEALRLGAPRRMSRLPKKKEGGGMCPHLDPVLIVPMTAGNLLIRLELVPLALRRRAQDSSVKSRRKDFRRCKARQKGTAVCKKFCAPSSRTRSRTGALPHHAPTRTHAAPATLARGSPRPWAANSRSNKTLAHSALCRTRRASPPCVRCGR